MTKLVLISLTFAVVMAGAAAGHETAEAHTHASVRTLVLAVLGLVAAVAGWMWAEARAKKEEKRRAED